MVQAQSATQARCGNPACGNHTERQATGRPARYCSGRCRQAARRERLRLAEAEWQRAERPGADAAVCDQYRYAATLAAMLRTRDHAARHAAAIPCEIGDATAPSVPEQVIARAGQQGATDGEAGQAVSLPVIRDAGNAQGALPGSRAQVPRAWPPWAWSIA